MVLPGQCYQVLCWPVASPILLRARYAMSGTDLAYGATRVVCRVRFCYVLHRCYAMSSTDMGHGTTRLLLSWALPAACAPGHATDSDGTWRSRPERRRYPDTNSAVTGAGRGHGHLNCRSNLYVVRRLFLRGFTFHAVDTAWLRAKVGWS
eukprot:188828-Rhodomonas_salina.1